MLKRSDVKRVIDEATVRFEQCWGFLASLKNGKLRDDNGLTILQFQPELAAAISDLSSIYRRLAEEKDATVQRKRSLAPTWFVRRMRFLSSEQDVVRRVHYIGKSIGDGFAWFFYQNNVDYLNEHLKEPAQLLMPSGVGGYAELETVKKIPVASGHFLLYHGITSVLRLGDFSLINMKNLSVVTVGEIKAGKPSDGKLHIQMIFPCDPVTGDVSGFLRTPPQNSRAEVPHHALSASAKDRLNRQMHRMATAHSKLTSRPDRHLSYEIEDRYADFDRFLTGIRHGRISSMHMGESMLLIGLSIQRTSLYTRLAKSTKTDWKRKFEVLQRDVVGLIIPDRKDNAIYVGSWYYDERAALSPPPGMTHPIWWPFSAENLRRIIFQEVLLFSIFNPAYLIQKLEGHGFTVTETPKRNFSAEKRIDDRIIQLSGISHYFWFIQQYFFNESDVVAMLEQVEDQIASASGVELERINLQFVQRFGKPPGTGKGEA